MIKIQIKNRFTGSIIFEHEKENNTISETVKEFIRKEIEAGKTLADLSLAGIDKRYIQVSRLGSAKRRQPTVLMTIKYGVVVLLGRLKNLN